MSHFGHLLPNLAHRGMHSGEPSMVDDTDGKAEASDVTHGSRERAERTDVQMLSVLHTPLLLMEAGECPGCLGCSHSVTYFEAQQS